MSKSPSRLTIGAVVGSTPAGKLIVTATCECGTVKEYVRSKVLSGHVRSCGCLHRERAASLRRSHGLRSNPAYGPWYAMVSRCTNPDNPKYDDYGGRGIVVCGRWVGEGGLSRFLEDMGERPSDEHTIERKDNDRDYTPDNCVWATMREQNRNKRTTRRLTAHGKTMALCDWAKETGLNGSTILARLRKGMSPDEALTRK